jgi:hypothetical protein
MTPSVDVERVLHGSAKTEIDGPNTNAGSLSADIVRSAVEEFMRTSTQR